jgi:hypothetical protein
VFGLVVIAVEAKGYSTQYCILYHKNIASSKDKNEREYILVRVGSHPLQYKLRELMLRNVDAGLCHVCIRSRHVAVVVNCIIEICKKSVRGRCHCRICSSLKTALSVGALMYACDSGLYTATMPLDSSMISTRHT